MRVEDTTSYDRWEFERAIRAAPLSMAAKCVGFALASRARRTTGAWVMCADTLARETGAHRSTVFRALADLEKAGLVRRIRRATKAGRRANGYQLLVPPDPKSHSATLHVSRGSPAAEARPKVAQCDVAAGAQCDTVPTLESYQPSESQEKRVYTNPKAATSHDATLATRPCMACGWKIPIDSDMCLGCGRNNLK